MVTMRERSDLKRGRVSCRGTQDRCREETRDICVSGPSYKFAEVSFFPPSDAVLMLTLNLALRKGAFASGNAPLHASHEIDSQDDMHFSSSVSVLR